MIDRLQQVKQKKLTFHSSGYYFLGLVLLGLLGFWSSYFSRLFDEAYNFNFYFHFHVLMVVLWIFSLVVQPFLVIKKRFHLHKIIGKVSYFIMPLFILSVILLTHHTVQGKTPSSLGAALWIPAKDLFIIAVLYSIAVTQKRKPYIHARAMIGTGIIFIEPALIRFLINLLPENFHFLAYYVTIGIIYAIILVLIVVERNQKAGRWIFPMLLLLLISFHYVILKQTTTSWWDAYAKWFAALPLT